MAAQLTTAERDWLLEPGSLTQRIRARCGERFHLDVLREQTAAAEELPHAWPTDMAARLREVTLNCGETALVFARTLLPDPVATPDHWIMQLGNKPLGDVLFQSGGERQAGFELALLTAEHDLFQAAQRQRKSLSGNMPVSIWARRSWVQLGNERLLICECFLPGLI